MATAKSPGNQSSMHKPRRAAALLALLTLAAPAVARTLDVGPEAPYHTMGQAIAQAKPGDTVKLAPGEYFECAQITVPDLTIQGAGPTTVITDTTCYGKALLIGRANNLTVRDLVLARARVPDMNGAGIRMEGQGLVVERVRFQNDQVGVLGGNADEIRLTECVFESGGVAGERPGNAVWIGTATRLLIERSTFTGVKGGQIASNADQTELVGNRIETGIEPGAGHAVSISRGTLLMRGNTLAIGPNPPPRNAAVATFGASADLAGNRLENTTGQPAAMLLDWMRTSPVLGENTVRPGDTVATTDGVWRHRIGRVARTAIGDARAAAGATKRAIMGALGR